LAAVPRAKQPGIPLRQRASVGLPAGESRSFERDTLRALSASVPLISSIIFCLKASEKGFVTLSALTCPDGQIDF
jgi:hypothetical protein